MACTGVGVGGGFTAGADVTPGGAFCNTGVTGPPVTKCGGVFTGVFTGGDECAGPKIPVPPGRTGGGALIGALSPAPTGTKIGYPPVVPLLGAYEGASVGGCGPGGGGLLDEAISLA